MKNNKLPKPPLCRIVKEDESKICHLCKSSVKRNFFRKIIGCIQPECENYYLNNK